MKCNKCGQENITGAKFCSACGYALEQDNVAQSTFASTSMSTSATPVVTTTPITSGGFNNLNAMAQTKKNPANIIMIIECVVGILFVVVVVGLVIWSILGKGGESKLSCEKETKAVSSSLFLTYKKEEVSKLELLYIIDQTVDSDTLRGADVEDYMSAGFINMALAQYDGEDGITYSYSEGKALTTISFAADLVKMKKSDAEDLLDSFADGGATIDKAKKALSDEGYTCTVK